MRTKGREKSPEGMENSMKLKRERGGVGRRRYKNRYPGRERAWESKKEEVSGGGCGKSTGENK